ncbi:MAG TPA: SdrD B-like domain-containing protein [Gemmataceae bacterium]|jgi:cyclophilin family peptidyl-prolyl cis-trans isomerase|nr:SdrD B-like domain-containing protein [Gemmataceae bacterium]
MRRTNPLIRPIVSSRRPKRTTLRVESLEGREVPSVASGTLFRDINGDGLRQNTDPLLAGVTVQIFDGDTQVGTTTTLINGTYSFRSLAASTDYQIRIDLTQAKLSGFIPTPMDQGDDDTIDSDADYDADNHLATIDLTTDDAGVATQSFDAGFTSATANLTLGGQVYNDADNSGTFDDGESGIAGVSVALIGGTSDTVQATAFTDADGKYSFSGLTAGDYRVRLAGINFSGSGKLAGLQPSSDPSTDPNDDVTGDSNGQADGTLGSGGTVVTGPITLSAGDEPTDDGDTNPNTNLSLDFGMTGQSTGGGTGTGSASLAGRVFLDYNNNGTADGPDGGMSGVTVTLTGGDLSAPVIKQTAVDGSFSFTGLNAGTYTITETQPTSPANRSGKSTAGTANGSTATANVISGITLAASTAATGYAFAEVPLVNTSGNVFVDGNLNGSFDNGETGINGVTVTLSGTNVIDGAITPITAKTDAQGAYSFAGLTPGTYTITETQPTGYTDAQLQNGIPAGTIGTNKFTNIDLTSAASLGGYNFGEVANSTPNTSSIAGKVFVDNNGNGTQDSDDTGIAGVTIHLTGTPTVGAAVDKTTTTGSDGSFSFTGLAAGVYAIEETQPSGNPDGIETLGSAGGNKAVNDKFSAITLTADDPATGYLFAERPSTTTPTGNATSNLLPQLTVSAHTAAPGTTVVITASIKNQGTASAAATTANVALGGLQFVSATSGDYNATTRAWTVGDLAAGATATIEITARVPAAGSFVPAVRITSSTPAMAASANHLASATVAASASPVVNPVVTVSSAPKRWFLSSSYFGPTRTAPVVTPTPTPAPTVNPPETPTIALATASDTGTVGDNSTSLASVTLNGTTSPGATVRLVGRTTTTTADSAGAYSFAGVPLTTGVNNVTIRVANAGGTNSKTTTITRIDSPPTAPTLTLAAASDTGTVGDGSTSLATVILTGTTTAGAGVTLIETGATTTANASGTFTFTGVALTMGANTFTAKATNGGGTTTGTATTIMRVAGSTNAAPTVKTALSPVTTSAGGSKTIDLAGSFDDADITDTLVKFDTSAGNVNIELFDKQAPKTVANFLNYVNSGKYTNSIFHRSASSAGVPFVLQGGGFAFQPASSTITTIATDPAVQNEPDAVNRSNLKGTLAMAKLGGDPNSATDQFFFNLGNNSANLDNQNGGFTVFGKVVSAADQAVIDTLAALPTKNESAAPGLSASQKSAFGEIPLQNYTGTNFPTDTTKANYAIINGVTITQQTEALTYSIVSNSTPTVATASIINNRLTIQGVASGQTTVTIRATDKAGAHVDTTVTVTVS